MSGPGIFGELFRKQLPKRPQELSGPDERTTQTWLLLLKCWDHNPSVRPDASSVLKSVSFGSSDPLHAILYLGCLPVTSLRHLTHSRRAVSILDALEMI